MKQLQQGSHCVDVWFVGGAEVANILRHSASAKRYPCTRLREIGVQPFFRPNEIRVDTHHSYELGIEHKR